MLFLIVKVFNFPLLTDFIVDGENLNSIHFRWIDTGGWRSFSVEHFLLLFLDEAKMEDALPFISKDAGKEVYFVQKKSIIESI